MPYDPISPVRVVRGVLGIVPNNVDVNMIARVAVSQGDILQFDLTNADSSTDSNDEDGRVDSGYVAGVNTSDFVALVHGVVLADAAIDTIAQFRICGEVLANVQRPSGATNSGVGDTCVSATDATVGLLDSIFGNGETYRAILMEPLLLADQPARRLVLFRGTNDGFGTSGDPTATDGGGSGDYAASGGGGQNA